MRILFVAMADSVHTARWISQIADQEWDLHLFPAYPARSHPDLKNVSVHGVNRTSRNPSLTRRVITRVRKSLGRFRPQSSMDRPCPERELTRVIHRLQPDVIHSLEMQHAGYLTRAALDHCKGDDAKHWVYSSWGSDIYYFGNVDEHRDRIRRVLELCPYLISDCKRDIPLAKQFGFEGEVLGVFPGPGGFRIEQMIGYRKPGPVNLRRTIVLKGYHQQDWVGRGLVGLEAIHRCADALADYEIAVICAADNVRYAAEYVARLSGLNMNVLPRQSPHEEILRVLGRSRASIALSLSDGTPNTMLEAMVMGALPIQSDTVSTAEWIQDGMNGLLTPAEGVDAVETAIRRAVSDDELVVQADLLNRQITGEQISWEVVQPQVVQMYQRVASQETPSRSNSFARVDMRTVR